MTLEINRDALGKIFFAFSIAFLAYLLLTPLNHIVMQIDEYFTMTVSMLPVWDIITVNTWDVHPPLYYFMAKIVAKITEFTSGNLLFNLKLLSILAYVLTLILAVTRIRKDYGWFVCGLFALSISIMCEFSRYYLIGRMYSWAVFFVLMAFLSFKDIIENEGRKSKNSLEDKGNQKSKRIIDRISSKSSWILLSLFSLLAAYTHYFAAMSVGCIYFILLAYLIKERRDDIKIWMASAVACILLYAPWLPSLINQLVQVHKSYWITDITFQNIIVFLGYYGYSFDGLFSLFSIFVLIIIFIIYYKESHYNDNKSQIFDKNLKFLIFCGIGVYFGTIILGVSISLIFRPIIDARYLMPAAALLWLVISIIISKIKDKRMYLLAMALIVLLLISGIANTFYIYNDNYQSGLMQREYFENLTQDNNSMLIVATENDIMYYLCYSDQADIYCLNTSDVFGVSTPHLHRLFDFKSVNGTQIDELIAKNKDKDIYLLSWEEPKVNSKFELLFKQVELHYCKVIN